MYKEEVGLSAEDERVVVFGGCEGLVRGREIWGGGMGGEVMES